MTITNESEEVILVVVKRIVFFNLIFKILNLLFI